MDTQQAYDQWSSQYDTNLNRTRDLEAIALRSTLARIHDMDILEIGCGTGKNTEWLITKAKSLVGVDLSAAMLAKAKSKIEDTKLDLLQADITKPWNFTTQQFDLIVFSLVLEHIEDLDFIFSQCTAKLRSGGQLYIGELHPFKQYTGTKARFDTEAGTTVVNCYTHHLSDFTNAAQEHGFHIISLQEWFDEKREGIPRILSLLLSAAPSLL